MRVFSHIGNISGVSKLRMFSAVLAYGCFLFLPSAVACDTGTNCLDDLSTLLAAEDQAQLTDQAVPNTSLPLSISVDGETIYGSPAGENGSSNPLEAVDIQVKFDGLGVERQLSVGTDENKKTYARGEPVTFIGSWNYPGWIDRAEVRLFDAVEGRKSTPAGQPFAVLPLNSNNRAVWPGDIDHQGDLYYVLRVYDPSGRFDETQNLPLLISNRGDGIEDIIVRSGDLNKNSDRGYVQKSSDATDALVNQNQLAVSSIPLQGGIVTVYGKNVPPDHKVVVQGRSVPIGRDSDFVVQTILPPGEHIVDVRISDGEDEHSVEFEREVNIPDNEWFYVGIADVTVGKRFGKNSNLLVPAQPGEYDPVYKKGRLAFYLKGKVKGRYLVTASLDTREEDLDTLFSNLDKKDPRHLLRRLDPDDYYPVYGDDSITKEDAPTSGRFYIRVDRGQSHVMWGNFKTRFDGMELARYERGLYGAKADLRTGKATSFGEPVGRAQAFAAQPGSLPQLDEFQGTGGSVYFLRRQDISQGSEQVTVGIRDRVTGLVVERRVLTEGQDYSVDYVQGVIILTEPLSSTVTGSSAVLPSSLDTYNQYLVISYEYTPTIEDVDGYSYGARGEVWLFDRLRLGATGMMENTNSSEQSLLGIDATWRLSQNSYVQFEIAQSESDGLGFVQSTDGGFIFQPVSGVDVDGRTLAWRARTSLDLGELTEGSIQGSFGLGYEERDKGFNAPGRFTTMDERIWDASINVLPNASTSLKATYKSIDRGDGTSQEELSGDASLQINEEFSVLLGIQHSDSQSGTSTSDGSGLRTDVGARLTYNGFGEDEYYVFGQYTVAHDATRERNDRAGVGFKSDITTRLRAEGQLSYGTSGIGILAGLSYDPRDTDRYYIGYRLTPDISGNDTLAYDPFDRDNGTVVMGVKRKLSDSVSAWSEHDWDMMGTSQGLVQAYGVDYTPDAIWKVSASVEAGSVSDEVSGDFERIAPSVSFAYNDDERTASAKLEARFEDSDDGSRDRVTWLAQGKIGLRHDDDWRFLASVDAAISASDEADVLDADYIEASIGWAYRPVEDDRLNALFKYTYLHDLPASQQINADGLSSSPKQRSHILSADMIYDLNQHLSIGAKYGLRAGEVAWSRSDPDFVRSTAQLGVLRADYHVVKNWDLLVEGRALWLSELEQVNYGVLTGIYRHIGNNLKVGVGYNFGRFSDDLADLTLDDEGVFVNVIGKF